MRSLLNIFDHEEIIFISLDELLLLFEVPSEFFKFGEFINFRLYTFGLDFRFENFVFNF